MLEQVTSLEFTESYVTGEELGGGKGGDCWEMKQSQIIQDLLFVQGELGGHYYWLVKKSAEGQGQVCTASEEAMSIRRQSTLGNKNQSVFLPVK